MIMLAFELVMLVWVVIACALAFEQGPPPRHTWLVFGLLCTLAVVHVYSTRHGEERWRVARLAQEYIDHSGVWKVAAALVLPAHLVVAIIIAIRLQRWTLAHKAPYRVVYGTAAILGSALAANTVIAASPLQAWFTGESTLAAFPRGGVVWLGAAILGYFAVQTIMIGVVRGCWHGFSWSEMIGGRDDNAELGACIALGTIAATLTVVNPLLLVLVVGVCIFWTRTTAQRDKAELKSKVDGLTRVYNRAGFKERVNAFLGSRRPPKSAALLMLDLDHFKAVNDTHGHLNGDLVLSAFAATVNGEVRQGDLVSRAGGEEFMAFLPDTSLDEALSIAERIRCAVADLKVPATTASGGDPCVIEGLSVSIGVAVCRGDDATLEELARDADVAVYRAKEDGRNCVRVAKATLEADHVDESVQVLDPPCSGVPLPRDETRGSAAEATRVVAFGS